MGNIGLFSFIVLLFSIVVHEYAHGWMALRCGDPTAKYSGRLTFNPLPHIDPVGTVIFPLILYMSGFPVFGWAKPVPVNPYNFHNPGIDNVKVSAAGPASNILLALASTVGCIIAVKMNNQFMYDFFRFGIIVNLLLAIFNMIPLAPLDGSHILEYYIPREMLPAYHRLQSAGPIILLFLIMSGWIFGFSLLWTIILIPLNFLYGLLMSIIYIFT